MTRTYELYTEMLDAANSRIAELEMQSNNTRLILIEMGLPEEEIADIINGMADVSGLNAKRAEVAQLKNDLANLR
jgi:hypothetical protein